MPFPAPAGGSTTAAPAATPAGHAAATPEATPTEAAEKWLEKAGCGARGVAPDPHTGPKYCIGSLETNTKVYVIKGTDIYECLIMANETITIGGNEQVGYRIKLTDSEDPEDKGPWVHTSDVFRTLSGAQKRVEEEITKKGKKKGPMKEHDTRSKDTPQKEKTAPY